VSLLCVEPNIELKGMATAGAGPGGLVAAATYGSAGPTARVRLAPGELLVYPGTSAVSLETAGRESRMPGAVDPDVGTSEIALHRSGVTAGPTGSSVETVGVWGGSLTVDLAGGTTCGGWTYSMIVCTRGVGVSDRIAIGCSLTVADVETVGFGSGRWT